MNECDQMTTTWLVRRGSFYKQFRAEFSGGERKRGRRRQMKRVDSLNSSKRNLNSYGATSWNFGQKLKRKVLNKEELKEYMNEGKEA